MGSLASFKSLGLAPAVVVNLARLGYVEMTPIQSAALPIALGGGDLLAQAHTGSGKTVAFALEASALHGELEQRDRDQVLIRFANRSCSVLVATDVAARGLDIAQLEAVINVDVTHEPEVHVHRIGRTGRAGQPGLALNLASSDEMAGVAQIETLQHGAAKWRRLDELDTGSSTPLIAPMVTLQIVGGRKEKIRAGDILGALTKDYGFDAAQIGKINVTDLSTYVAIERFAADAVLVKLNTGMVKGRRVKARRIDTLHTLLA